MLRNSFMVSYDNWNIYSKLNDVSKFVYIKIITSRSIEFPGYLPRCAGSCDLYVFYAFCAWGGCFPQAGAVAEGILQPVLLKKKGRGKQLLRNGHYWFS
jgi:hypothetical protein